MGHREHRAAHDPEPRPASADARPRTPRPARSDASATAPCGPPRSAPGGIQRAYAETRERVGLPRTGARSTRPGIPRTSSAPRASPSSSSHDPTSRRTSCSSASSPGPAHGVALPAWWDDVAASDVPVVLVTQGTLNVDPHDLIEPAFAALGRQRVLVVATTGRADDAEPAVPGPAERTRGRSRALRSPAPPGRRHGDERRMGRSARRARGGDPARGRRRRPRQARGGRPSRLVGRGREPALGPTVGTCRAARLASGVDGCRVPRERPAHRRTARRARRAGRGRRAQMRLLATRRDRAATAD